MISTRPGRTFAGFCGSGSLVLGILIVAGCNTPPHVQQTMSAPLYDDVMAIMSTYRPNPWISFDTADPSRVNGMAINTYLISASSQKGVFGAGNIRVVLYADEGQGPTSRPGEVARPNVLGTQLFEWILPPDKAMPYRVMRRAERTYVMGDGYQLRLSWGEQDFRGRKVGVVVEYQRTDGRIVRRRPFWLQVPAPGQR